MTRSKNQDVQDVRVMTVNISRLKVELPVLVQDVNGIEDTLKVHTYIVEAGVPFLCGKSELQDKWKSKINTKSNILEVKMNGQRKEFRMIGTAGNHVALKIGNEELIDDKHNESDKCSEKYENKNDAENHKEEYDKKPENERKEPKKKKMETK